MVTLQNYEEYIMLYVDDELDAEATAALMDFLEEHPELKKELALYEKAKLPVATDIVFEDKELLLKRPAKIIAWNRWLAYATAASVLLLIALFVGKWMNRAGKEMPDVPEIAATPKDSAATIAATTIEPDTDKKVAVLIEEPKVNHKRTSIAKAPTEMKRQNNPVQKDAVVEPDDPGPSNPVYQYKEETQVAELKENVINETLPDPVRDSVEPDVHDRRNKRKGLLALLPVSQEKRQGLNHLKNKMESKVESVKDMQEDLKNTSFEVKLGNKELFVINL